MITAHYEAGFSKKAVLEDLGSAMRPLRNWSLIGLGQFGYAHRSGMARGTFKSGPRLGMTQSLPNRPRAMACWNSNGANCPVRPARDRRPG